MLRCKMHQLVRSERALALLTASSVVLRALRVVDANQGPSGCKQRAKRAVFWKSWRFAASPRWAVQRADNPVG